VDAKAWGDIPLFIREGAIIPQQAVMDYVGQHPVTALDVQVFPADSETRFDVYDDDGETYAYEKGAYFVQPLLVHREGSRVSFRTEAPKGSFKPVLHDYVLAVHGPVANSVRNGGQSLPAFDTVDALRNATTEGWARGEDRFGEVTYVKLEAGKMRDIQLDTVAVQQ
jgi:hypothetical protein